MGFMSSINNVYLILYKIRDKKGMWLDKVYTILEDWFCKN